MFLLFTTDACDELEPIANGMITYNMNSPYAVGTVATYSCNSGYELSIAGDEMRTCEEASDGSGAIFGGTAPTCERTFVSNTVSQQNSLGVNVCEIERNDPEVPFAVLT